MLRGSWREIPRDVLVLGEELGSGMFGRVVKAWLRKESGESQMCAVKMLKGEATNVAGGNDVAMPLFGSFFVYFFHLRKLHHGNKKTMCSNKYHGEEYHKRSWLQIK